DLAAVQPPAVAIARREGFDFQTVRAGIRFGERHAAIDLAGDDLWQQLGFHRIGTEARNRHAAENRVDHEELTDGGTATAGGERFHDQRHFLHAEGGAAILLGQRHAAKAGVADLSPELFRKALLGVALAPIVETEQLADLAGGFYDLFLIIRQKKIHGAIRT